MKKNAWMISGVAILVLFGTEIVRANSTVWLTENAMPEFDPMVIVGEKDTPATEADEMPVDLTPLEPQIKRQNDTDSGGKPDVRRDKPTRFGVGYEYRMRRNGSAVRPDRVQRPDRPGRPNRPGR